MKGLRQFVLISIVSIFPNGRSRAASITDLGVLPGYSNSAAAAISADGKMVVGACSKYVDGQSIVEPFLWTTEQGIIGLGWPAGSTNFTATGVSTNGVVVGNSALSDDTYAFKWSAQTGYVQLTPYFGQSASAKSISANGQVIVGVANNQAAKWNAANEIALLPFAEARDVSGDGSVIVGIDIGTCPTSYYYIPIRWRDGDGAKAEDINTIENLPEGFTLYTANGVSPDGKYIVGLCKTPLYEEAYIWSEADGVKNLGNIDGYTYVPPKKTAANPLPIYTEAYSVSNDGSAAVGRNFPGWSSATFIWTAEDGPRTIAQVLNQSAIFDPQWNATQSLYFGSSTTDISADGSMIVGSMPRASDGIRAFLLDLRNIKAVQNQSGLQLTWPDGFKLQESEGLNLASWHDVPTATSPFPVFVNGSGQFYRIVTLR